MYPAITLVEYRVSGSLLVPYRVLTFKDSPNSPIRPIAQVIVGPTPHQELAIRTTKELLARAGFENIPVLPSQTPYRNY
jgi:hypothetical protein